MCTFIRSAKTAFLACALFLTLSGVAVAETPASPEYFTVATGRFDLLRAHNERMLVFFGRDVTFKRYSLVDFLHQYFTVASDVRGGVRYVMHEYSGEKTLIID